MRLHILIPAFLAGAVLTAAGPLIADASLIAQTQAEVTTCSQCANNLCGLCPPSLFCTACFDKANCYACPYMESCSEKDPCVCYDFCSKGLCKGTEDCVSETRSRFSSFFMYSRALTGLSQIENPQSRRAEVQQILSRFLRKSSSAPHRNNSMDIALIEFTKKSLPILRWS